MKHWHPTTGTWAKTPGSAASSLALDPSGIVGEWEASERLCLCLQYSYWLVRVAVRSCTKPNYSLIKATIHHKEELPPFSP